MNRINESLAKKYSAFQGRTRILLTDNYNALYYIAIHQVIILFGFVGMFIIFWWFNIVTFGYAVLESILQGFLVGGFLFKFRKEFQHVKSVIHQPDFKTTEYFTLYQKCQPGITELEEELKEIKKGNDFLNDLIDLQ